MKKINLGFLALLGVLAAAVPQQAYAVAALATGVPDITEYYTLFVAGLVLVVAAVLGGIFGFLVVKKGISWAKRAI